MNTTPAPTPTATPRWHRPLTASGIVFAALTAFAFVAMFVDDRTLMGESVWLKVFKFSFAFFAYNLTLAWLIGHMTRARRFGWWSGTVFAALSVFEVGVIAMAASLGTYSHFNSSDELSNQIVQNAFQYGVPVLFMINFVMAIVVLWQRIGDRAVTAVIRWGLLLSTLGMIAAFFIVGLSKQRPRTVEDAYGDPVELSSGHGIGDPDGNGMFLTNWSVTGGDLRVPHFIGLHGIQVLIAAALVLSVLAVRFTRLRDERVRAGIIHSLGLGYLGLFATTTWQAVRGQSLIAPDAATLAALAASAAVAVIGVAVAICRARKATPMEDPIPADFVREAEKITAQDWEPAVPLR
ncbi:hypothetical protein [Glycomyces arizonensis]|uniref:hypothetical protein n=1 Tax=Glycomyces arizonensis TaxID=256035 RepID=UPI000414C779|nr:hypothetical protein [Glycomyces arizonensis]